jgi:hypothetical protein
MCQPGRSERRTCGMPFQSSAQRAFSLKWEPRNCHRTGAHGATCIPWPRGADVKPIRRVLDVVARHVAPERPERIRTRGEDPMAKATRKAAEAGEKIRAGDAGRLRRDLQLHFACPAAGGYPTGGFCGALVAYHIRRDTSARRVSDSTSIYAAAWPKAIHQGGGTLRLYISEERPPSSVRRWSASSPAGRRATARSSSSAAIAPSTSPCSRPSR